MKITRFLIYKNKLNFAKLQTSCQSCILLEPMSYIPLLFMTYTKPGYFFFFPGYDHPDVCMYIAVKFFTFFFRWIGEKKKVKYFFADFATLSI